MGLWTDLAQWRGPTPNQGPKMQEQRGLVIHIAEGYYEGTISWQKNPNNNVSSHFVLAGPRDQQFGTPDGKLAQVVDTETAAWTQRAGNGHWGSVECSGFVPDRLSAAQMESVAQLLARYHKVYGVPLQVAHNPDGRGLGHHSMGCDWPSGAWGHCDCPGDNIIAQKPQIVERAKQIIDGGGPSMLFRAQLADGTRLVGNGKESWPFTGNQEQWDGLGWAIAHPGVVLTYGTAPADYYYDIIGAPVGEDTPGGITIAQVNQQIAASKLTPPA